MFEKCNRTVIKATWCYLCVFVSVRVCLSVYKEAEPSILLSPKMSFEQALCCVYIFICLCFWVRLCLKRWFQGYKKNGKPLPYNINTNGTSQVHWSVSYSTL